MNDIIRKINDVVWHTLNIDTKFNFIDIIKGVVPLTFLDKIQKLLEIEMIRKLLYIIIDRNLFQKLIISGDNVVIK
jgi:hypothetical protein